MSTILKIVIKKNDFKKLDPFIDNLKRGAQGELRSVFLGVAKAMVGQVQRDFNDRSRRKVRKWQPISPMTLLLRRSVGRKIRSMDEAKRRAGKAPILADTGRLRNSINGRAGFVQKLKGLTISVGTNVKYADIHQQTLASRSISRKFKPTKRQISNFENNFSKTKVGSKPKRTPTGRVSRAKKHWNKEFFIILNSLKKQSRQPKKVSIPKRAFLPQTKAEKKVFKNKSARIFEKGLREVLGDI